MTSYYQQPAYLMPETRARSVDINTLNEAVKAGFDAIPGMDQVWTGAHDFTAGRLRARTPVAVTEVATKGYVDKIAFDGVLPITTDPGRWNLLVVSGTVDWERSQILENRRRMSQVLALQLALG